MTPDKPLVIDTKEEVHIDKNSLKGKCITCRRGVFTLFTVWCIHSKNPEGYKTHSPFYSCPFYEMSFDFKLLDKLMTIQRHDKYVDPYLKANGVEVKPNENRTSKEFSENKNADTDSNDSNKSDGQGTSSIGTRPDKISSNSKSDIKEYR
jgi:hypothetical protein